MNDWPYRSTQGSDAGAEAVGTWLIVAGGLESVRIDITGRFDPSLLMCGRAAASAEPAA